MSNARIGSIVTASFVVISCMCLASVIWLVYSELLVDSRSEASDGSWSIATKITASDSPADLSGSESTVSVAAEKTESGSPAGLLQESHPNAGDRLETWQAEPAIVSAMSPAKPSAKAVNSAVGPFYRASEPAFQVSNIQVVFKTERHNKRLGRTITEWRPALSYAVAANQITIEARVLGGPNRGERVDLKPVWIPADPEMVSVSPQPGPANTALITVLRTGQSTVLVSSQGISKVLTVNAEYEDAGMRVQVSQATGGKTIEQ